MSNEEFEALMPKVPFCRVGDVVGRGASMVWGTEDSFLYTADQMRQMFDAATERAAKLASDLAADAAIKYAGGYPVDFEKTIAAAIRGDGSKA